MAIFNAEEKDFLDKTEKLMGTDNNWEAHVTQQIPLPRTSPQVLITSSWDH